MDGSSLDARIPIQIAQRLTVNSPSSTPIINYEPTGLSTDISMRKPLAAGGENIALDPLGDAIILVMSAKRSPK